MAVLEEEQSLMNEHSYVGGLFFAQKQQLETSGAAYEFIPKISRVRTFQDEEARRTVKTKFKNHDNDYLVVLHLRKDNHRPFSNSNSA